MDGPADSHGAIPSPSEESEVPGDPSPRPGLLERVLRALVSPFRPYIVDSVEERQRQMGQSLSEIETKLAGLESLVEERTRFLEKLGSAQEAMTTHIGALESARISAIDDINLLREDAGRARDHLVALQEQSSELQKAAVGQANRGDRFEDLWADLHRDMTALAEALSRLGSD